MVVDRGFDDRVAAESLDCLVGDDRSGFDFGGPSCGFAAGFSEGLEVGVDG